MPKYRDAEFEAKEMVQERNYQARGIEATNSPTTIEDMLVALDNENQRMSEMILALRQKLGDLINRVNL